MAFSIRLDVKGFDKRIKQLTEEIERHESAKGVLIHSIAELEAIENKSFKDTIILMHLKLHNVVDVAAKLNEAGLKVKTDTRIGQRKYDPNDITEIVFYDQENDSKYFKIARAFNKYNSRLIKEKELINQLLLIEEQSNNN